MSALIEEADLEIKNKKSKLLLLEKIIGDLKIARWPNSANFQLGHGLYYDFVLTRINKNL